MKSGLTFLLIMSVCFLTGCLGNSADSENQVSSLDLYSVQQNVPTFEDELAGMGIYYGNFHSHSKVSNAEGTPEEVLAWARDVAGFDFYVMTDHAEQIWPNEWKEMKVRTDEFNEDGVFVAMRGFEWSHSMFGHVCVYNTDKYTSATFSPLLFMFYYWLDRNDALAQFNHPGREELVFRNLMYVKRVADNFVAMETGNKDVGNNDHTYLNMYPNALDEGWRVAPTSNQDNHKMRTNSHRTAAVMDNLSR
jgi:hypothetical protein